MPHDELDAEVDRWCAEMLERSPTALALAKRSFNADTESIRGISSMGMAALSLYYDTEESKEGGRAYREKRKPDFSQVRSLIDPRKGDGRPRRIDRLDFRQGYLETIEQPVERELLFGLNVFNAEV